METSVAMCFLLIVLVVNDVVHNDVTSAVAWRPDLCLGDRTQNPSSTWTTCGEGRCRCTEDTADCSGRELDFVPQIPPSVRYLDFSRNELPMNIDLNIENYRHAHNFFSNATGITHLKLVEYLILPELVNVTFHKIRNLTCLSVRLIRPYGVLVSGSSRKYALNFLESVTMIPTLRQLACIDCELTEWPDVTGSHIKTLHLTSNVFVHVHYFQSEAFPDLEELFLDYCNIRSQKWVFPVSVKTLRLDHNLQTTFMFPCDMVNIERPDIYLDTLEHLNLSYNNIEAIIGNMTCAPQLKTIDLRGNKLKDFSPYKFHLSFNYFLTDTDGSLTSFLNPIKNKTAFTSQSLYFLSVAENHVDFSVMASASCNYFTDLPFLQEMILDGNDMSQVADDRFMELFGYLTHLTTLSVRKCRLDTIFSKTLSKFRNLSTLYLSGNVITSIPDGVFDSLPSLSHLDLSGNPITTVSQDAFSAKTLHQLSSVHLASISFVCSCNILWFRQTLIENPAKFYPSTLSHDHRYTCGNIPGTTIEEFGMNEQACLLSQEVSIQIIAISILIISTLTMVSLVSRYRWHLRLIMYEAFRGRDEVRRLRLEHDHFGYDVFVSYDSENFAWVHEQLMPKLENDLGLSLCIHERDFLLGKHIVDNIVDCVESSKKVLVVFSKDFAASQWCQFELTYCLRHVMDYDDALIVVCVDDVAASRDMTAAMLAVMKTTTYIQWVANNADAVHSFWARLHLALKEILVYGDQAV